MNPLLTIIVVSYNTRDLTLACLKSLYEQTKNILFEVIVVDNNSIDGSALAIAKEFPQAKLTALNENIGFAAANNLAAIGVTSKYILLLNPDTVALDRAIEKLVFFAEKHPKAGIWGGRTLYGDYSLNPTSCWKKMTPWSLLCRALHLSTLFPKSELFNPEGYGAWQRDTVREVDIVTGCFFLIQRELWEQLGGFDPIFFMYGEEADLCFRAKAKGFKPIINPEATIIHYGGLSEKVRSEKEIKLLIAKVLLIKRNWHHLMIPVGKALLLIFVINKIFLLKLALLLKNNPKFKEKLNAWLTVWQKRQRWLKGDFNLLL